MTVVSPFILTVVPPPCLSNFVYSLYASTSGLCPLSVNIHYRNGSLTITLPVGHVVMTTWPGLTAFFFSFFSTKAEFTNDIKCANLQHMRFFLTFLLWTLVRLDFNSNTF